MQGINDLVTPFLAVFLGQHFDRGAPLSSWDLTALPDEVMLEVLPPSPLHPCNNRQALLKAMNHHEKF